MQIFRLFFEFLKISLFVVGGGYAILAVADSVAARCGWTKEGEVVDHLPVFQTLPGLIATHTAVYVGRKVAGPLGAFASVVGVAIPSVVIFLIVATGYRALPLDSAWLTSAFVGLRSALTGVILAAILKSWKRNLPDVFSYVLAAIGVAAIGPLRVPVAAVLLTAMAVGTIRQFAEVTPTDAGAKVFRSSAWLAVFLFLKYGLLGFGGGFVLVPMYIQDFVGETAAWLQLPRAEFSDVMALSQMTPGPIGVNAATFFGYRLCGIPGALAASALLLLPGSLLCMLALSSLERFRTSRVVRGIMRGIRPVSVALMTVSLAEFAQMSAVDARGAFHPLALPLIALAALAMSRRWLSAMALVFASAALALGAETLLRLAS